MAYVSQSEAVDTNIGKGVVAQVFGVFTSFFKFFDLMAAANARAAELDALSAKSDAQLAEMGLRREDISRYVFRDILYV